MTDDEHRTQLFFQTLFSGASVWGWRCLTCATEDSGWGSANAAQDSADIHEATA